MYLSGLTYKNKIRVLFIPIFLMIGIGLLIAYEISYVGLKAEHHQRLIQTSALTQKNLALMKKELTKIVRLFQRNRTLVEYLYITTVLGGDPNALLELLRPMAVSLEIDTIILYDAEGSKVQELNPLAEGEHEEPFASISPSIQSGFTEHHGLVDITAVGPLLGDDKTIGYVAVGKRLNDAFLRQLGEQSGNELFLEKDGKILASTFGEGQPLPDRGRSLVQVNDTPYSFQKLFIDDMSGHRLGSLSVALSGRDLTSSVFRLKLFMAALFTASIAVFLGLTVVFTKTLVDPIKRIVSFILGIAQGNLDQTLAVAGRDEIATLSSHLNTMQRELKASRALAEQYTVTLEHAVAERTAELEKVQSQLLQSQKMEAVGQLAGGIAHDFNNLLSVIIGYGEMTRNSMRPDDPCREFLTHVLTASEKAEKLVGSLLSFSRQEVVELRPVDINNVVEHMRGILRRLIREDLDLVTHLDSRPLTVIGDHGQMEQVLLNLVANGRDAIPGRGTITVTTSFAEVEERFGDGPRPGRYVQITVADTGVGMDAAQREKVFEPFFTTKEVGKGTGLGLSIVYGVVKKHGGHVHVYSEVGRGSEFKVYLPFVDTAEQDEPLAMDAYPEGGTECILLAEDDPGLRGILKNVLQDSGYTVLEAENGAQAVQVFCDNETHVDLLLSDVIMPEKSGKEALDEIRQTRPDMRAIFMSGYTADHIRQEDLGPHLQFVSKPIKPKDLLTAVRTVLT